MPFIGETPFHSRRIMWSGMKLTDFPKALRELARFLDHTDTDIYGLIGLDVTVDVNGWWHIHLDMEADD